MRMCVRLCICVWVHESVCTSAYMFVCGCMRVCVRLCIIVCVCAHENVCTSVHMCLCVGASECVYVCAYVCVLSQPSSQDATREFLKHLFIKASNLKQRYLNKKWGKPSGLYPVQPAHSPLSLSLISP